MLDSPAERIEPGGMIYAAVSVLWNVNALIALNRFDDAEALMLNRLPEYRKLAHKDYFGLTL